MEREGEGSMSEKVGVDWVVVYTRGGYEKGKVIAEEKRWRVDWRGVTK